MGRRRTWLWLGLAMLGAVCWQSPRAWAQNEHRMPVYFQDSPAALEMVERARALAAQDRATDAVALLEQVVQQHGQKLVPAGQGLYLSASQWVWRQIVENPTLLEAYRDTFSAKADHALAQAVSKWSSSAVGGADRAADIKDVMTRYFPTPAGLTAGLDAAAADLERADVAAAQSVLDQLTDHPDLPNQRARYERLSHAVTAAGDRLRPSSASNAAAPQAGKATLLPIDSLQHPLWQVEIERDEPARSGRYPSSEDQPRPVIPVTDARRLYLNEGNAILALDRFSGRRLWRFSQPQAERDETMPMILARMGRRVSDQRGVLLWGDHLLAVVGQATRWPMRVGHEFSATALICLDRHTGKTAWRISPAALGDGFDNAYFVGTPLASYDRVFVLIRRRQATGLEDTLAAAVDAASGHVLWHRHISSAVTDSRFGASAPVPRMTLGDGTLYVCDHVAALAALADATGMVRWVRLISTNAVNPPTHRRNRTAPQEDGPEGRPVLLPAGLLMPPLHPDDPALLLDRDHGAILRSLSGPKWNGVQYVLGAGDDVVAVSDRMVTLFDGRTLEPRWSVPVGQSDGGTGPVTVSHAFVAIPGPGRLVLIDRATGSVAATVEDQDVGDALVLDGQLVFSGAHSIRSFMPWSRAHEALAAQVRRNPHDPDPGLAIAQLALTTDHHEAFLEGVKTALSAVRTAPSHQATLQQRVFEELLAFADPQRNDNQELRAALLDRLAAATASPSQAVAYHLARGRLFEDAARWSQAAEQYQVILLDPALASQMYHRQDVLRQAGVEAKRRLTKLIEAHGEQVYQQFNLIAAQRLASLMRQPDVDPGQLIQLADRYPLADAAPQALYQAGVLLARQKDLPQAATQLRRAYAQTRDPALLARTAGRLAVMYEQDDRPRRAISWLRRVRREHPNLLPLRDGRPVSVEQWLSDLKALPTVTGPGPTLRLPLAAPYVLAGQLLVPTQGDRLAHTARDRLLLEADGVFRLYGGSPLQSRREFHIPFKAPDQVELLAMNDRQAVLWSPAGGGELALLNLGKESTGDGVGDADTVPGGTGGLSARAQTDAELTGGQAASGTHSIGAASRPPDWILLHAHDQLEPLGEQEIERERHPVEQRRFMRMIDVQAPIVIRNGRLVVERPPSPHGVLAAVGDSMICLADRKGGVVGIDRHTGRVMWRKVTSIEQTLGITASGDVVVLSGVNGSDTDAKSGVIQVLDMLTGEARLPLIEGSDTPQWIGFAGDGLMLAATDKQVTAYRLANGAVIWRVSITGASLTGQGWANDDLALLATDDNGLVALDVVTGESLSRLNLATAGGLDASQTRVLEDRWQLLGSLHALALGAQGEVLWRDAISPLDHHLLLQLVGEKYVVLVSERDPPAQGPQGGPAVMPEPGVDAGAQDIVMMPGDAAGDGDTADADASPTVYVLNRMSGSIVAQYRLAGLPAAIDAQPGLFLDHRLILPAGDQTVVIPDAGAR